MGPDFDFQLAANRRLKGHGVKGLIALAMMLSCLHFFFFRHEQFFLLAWPGFDR